MGNATKQFIQIEVPGASQYVLHIIDDEEAEISTEALADNWR
jgi:hypothetical protein